MNKEFVDLGYTRAVVLVNLKFNRLEFFYNKIFFMSAAHSEP